MITSIDFYAGGSTDRVPPRAVTDPKLSVDATILLESHYDQAWRRLRRLGGAEGKWISRTRDAAAKPNDGERPEDRTDDP